MEKNMLNKVFKEGDAVMLDKHHVSWEFSNTSARESLFGEDRNIQLQPFGRQQSTYASSLLCPLDFCLGYFAIERRYFLSLGLEGKRQPIPDVLECALGDTRYCNAFRGCDSCGIGS